MLRYELRYPNTTRTQPYLGLPLESWKRDIVSVKRVIPNLAENIREYTSLSKDLVHLMIEASHVELLGQPDVEGRMYVSIDTQTDLVTLTFVLYYLE